MVSYKMEYMKCDEEREKLKKQIEKLNKDLEEAYLELKLCMTKEEKEVRKKRR
jgi:copper chaperone CopZ